MISKRILCGFLAVLMLSSVAMSFVGCGDGSDDPIVTIESTETDATETETEVDNRFDGINYGGKVFRIYTSVNEYGMSSSNLFIEGSDELNGAVVNDSVLERNLLVEGLLGVDLEFTQVNLSWGAITSDVRTLMSSGLDEFDLMINDYFDYSTLSLEGHFHNVAVDDCVFDFDRPYWYKDYMEELTFKDGYQYMLAGDYFMDVIRTARGILVNKTMYESYIKSSPDELYDLVLNYQWTYEKLSEIVSQVYVDMDNNSRKSRGDIFGFMGNSVWGMTPPLVVSCNPTFVTRDEEGIPTMALHEGDRANLVADAMRSLLNNEGTGLDLMDGAWAVDAFAMDETLFSDMYMGMLESDVLRGMKGDSGVLPYPMLMESDRKYTTCTMEITEVGVVPVTAPESNLEYISTVIEVLNRETANIVMPEYYSKELKGKLIDDAASAAMIDIIHDNFGGSFILAYNSALDYFILQVFSECVTNKREFSAVWARNKKRADKAMERLTTMFLERIEAE